MKGTPLYTLIFKDSAEAAQFMAYAIKKVKRVGYLSVKDVICFNGGYQSHLGTLYSEILKDYDDAEFIGWNDNSTKVWRLCPVPVKDSEERDSESCVLYLSQPTFIVSTVLEHMEKYIRDFVKEEK